MSMLATRHDNCPICTCIKPLSSAVDYMQEQPIQDHKKEVREKQSRLESTLEVGLNIFSGFIVSYLVWLYIVPIFWPEHTSSYGVAFGIVILFTISSIIRSYLWRRFFENELHKLVHKFVTK